jgi:hypothetical protein
MPDAELSRAGKNSSPNQVAGRRIRSRKSQPNSAALSLPPDERDFREAREEMIRVAAYYLAEKRGFVPGAELDDWLIAESEIDARLKA